MESVKTQITDFLDKCEELKKCKFIMATTKIKDVLKSIANSRELYELFNTVVSKFDYLAAKQRCFVETDNGLFRRCALVLPDTIGDRLAFIFCLLVEFDRDDINFNAFLQKYYPKDGSYYASFHMFCDEVIGSLETIICDIFSQELASEEPARALPQRSSAAPEVKPDANAAASINTILLLIAREKDYVSSSSLSGEDREAATSILDCLSAAVRRGDAALINALTCGYNYFVLYNKAFSDELPALINMLGEYVATL